MTLFLSKFRIPNGAGRRRDHDRNGDEAQTRERNLQRRLFGQIHAGQRYDDRRKTGGVEEVEIGAAGGEVRVGLARLAAVEKGHGNVRGERRGCDAGIRQQKVTTTITHFGESRRKI